MNRPSNKLLLPIASNDRSCAVCPSAMTDTDMVVDAAKGVNGPTCSLKMLPLLRPSAPQEVQVRTTQTIAKNCDAFGKPAEPISETARTDALVYRVGFPRPNPVAVDTHKPRSCTGCAHFVRAFQVMEETGWNAGLCLAKGSLLLTDRLSRYADGCKDSAGIITGREGTLEGFPFMPEYRQDFGKPNILGNAKRYRDTPPQKWASERQRNDRGLAHDRKYGIRAWRKIDDPENYGPSVFLPIFDLDAMSPDLKNKVPMSGDDEHPEDYIDHAGAAYRVAAMWRGLDETPMVWGTPGTGKTELFRYLAWLMSAPFHRLSITASTELDDLAGKMHYSSERGTYFEYGRLPAAWQQIGVVCLDEPNVGPPDVWQFIRPLTDNSKQLVLDMNKGERIPRHQYAFLGMAANPAWDSRNVGTATIGDADARRLMHIWMPLPPPDIEKAIIQRRCAEINYDPSEHIENIMKISKEIRSMIDNGDLASITWGVANNIKVAKAFRFFPPMRAYAAAVLDYLEPESVEPIRTAISSYYPV